MKSLSLWKPLSTWRCRQIQTSRPWSSSSSPFLPHLMPPQTQRVSKIAMSTWEQIASSWWILLIVFAVNGPCRKSRPLFVLLGAPSSQSLCRLFWFLYHELLSWLIASFTAVHTPLSWTTCSRRTKSTWIWDLELMERPYCFWYRSLFSLLPQPLFLLYSQFSSFILILFRRKPCLDM